MQLTSDSSVRNNNMMSQGGFNSAHGMINSTSALNSAGSGSGPKAAEINLIANNETSSQESEHSKDEEFDFSGGFERPDTPSI